MSFDVATLLQDSVGVRRRLRLDGGALSVSEEHWSAVASGDLEFMRTPRGLLVHAELTVSRTFECARCLTRFDENVQIRFDEEFVALFDPITGAPQADIEDHEFRIDARSHLDLSDAVRQYESTVLPLQPVCQEDCRGLCPDCGQDFNESRCDCAASQHEPTWAPLAALADRLRANEAGTEGATDGSPEAEDAESQTAPAP